MDRLTAILAQVLADVGSTLAHSWPFLLASVVVASAIQVYLGTDRLARWMRAGTGTAVVGAVCLGALTPLCSCGTTAVVLGAMASAVPWAPLVAFMVSSPLTSPGEYVLSVGLFGAPFATTFVVAVIVIGLLAGAVTAAVERTGLLAGQARMTAPPEHASPPSRHGRSCLRCRSHPRQSTSGLRAPPRSRLSRLPHAARRPRRMAVHSSPLPRPLGHHRRATGSSSQPCRPTADGSPCPS